jgi:hypothetical protein
MSDPKQALQQSGDGAPPAPAQVSVEGVEDALLDGDLSKLNSEQRLDYYEKVCESVGLNPLTKPFEYIRLNGQLTLYATRAAAEQLRKVNGISITDLEETWRDSLCIFRAKAEDAEGRTDVATGAVDTSRSSGQDLANDIMKAETKAKRRVTLSLAGLGWLDETEVSDIPDQATEEVNVDYDTGEVKTQKPDTWYKQATDWLIDTVQDGEAEASDVLANADSVPSEHPIDDWPDDYAEAAIEHIKNAATLSEDAGEETPTSESPDTSEQASEEAQAENEPDPEQVKEAADAVEVEGEGANDEAFEDGDGLPF